MIRVIYNVVVILIENFILNKIKVQTLAHSQFINPFAKESWNTPFADNLKLSPICRVIAKLILVRHGNGPKPIQDTVNFVVERKALANLNKLDATHRFKRWIRLRYVVGAPRWQEHAKSAKFEGLRSETSGGRSKSRFFSLASIYKRNEAYSFEGRVPGSAVVILRQYGCLRSQHDGARA